MSYLVIDFGGTLAKYSVMDGEGNAIASGEAPAPVTSKGEFVRFVTDLRRQEAQHGIAGVAISMPGVIDGERDCVVTGGAYVHLDGTDLGTELGGVLDVPFSVENDGKCGALAELWGGGLQGCRNGIVIILGTAVAGGIIVDGKLYRGSRLNAGEFSNLMIGEEPGLANMAASRCGFASQLFQANLAKGIDIRSMPAYPFLSGVLGEVTHLSELNDDPAYAGGMDGLQFFSFLERGDEDVSRIYGRWMEGLAAMICNLQVAFAPDRILIGGGVSRQERLIPDIASAYREYTRCYEGIFDVSADIARCRYGNEANQRGALYALLSRHPELRP